MLKFYYNPAYKYTNRTIIDVTSDTNYIQHDYENIDSPDTINGHIIYVLGENETLPTYIVDTVSGWRWFVSGITQLRTGKYQISLLRDIISESPEIWKQEQAYITAGTATNYNRYKRWNLPYTNTKVRQERLNINGKSSFFVFYVNEQHINSNAITEDDLHITYSSIPGITNFDYKVTDLSEIPNYQYLNAGDVIQWTRDKGIVQLIMNYRSNEYIRCLFDYDTEIENDFNIGLGFNNEEGWLLSTIRYFDVKDNVNNVQTSIKTAIKNYIDTYKVSLGTTISQAAVDSLEPYVGKIILNTTTNKIYKITKNINYYTYDIKLDPSSLYSALTNITWPNGKNIQSKSGNWFSFESTKCIYNYKLEELGALSTFDFNFRADVRKLPKSAVRCVNIISGNGLDDNQIAECLMLAQRNGINPDNTTGRILDIQYLPFNIPGEDAFITPDTDLMINSTPVNHYFLTEDDYQYMLNLTDLTNINKETDTIKIVSPSRASQFLFRPYDNDGNMEFNTKITLKPYLSTIYIRPSTKGLLVNDWDDKDCLIIQEDFSLTNISNEWTNYIYNNKNYSNIFERQMQGREYERSWERQVEEAQRKADEWNAKQLSADKVKTLTGNIPIVSGIMGAMATNWPDKDYMAAANLDRQYNEALYQEGMSLSRDLFEYQLDNIKAQPGIPSKITTIDCKFLDGVYLEFYSTNTTELNAIQNFYRYNGNRIDDYGTFDTYWGNFVKGKIIISFNYTQPEIDELNRRLSMGIFTGGIL